MSSKEYFNENASQWDEMREVFFSTAVRDKAFKMANLMVGKMAADIGAGTGFITEGLLEQGAKVIAVDESPNMVHILLEKYEKKDLKVCVGESMNLPIENESVDYVFANMYLHHVPNPEKAIQEMVRILKPHGKLVITDLIAHQSTFLLEEHHDRWLGFEEKDIEQWYKKSNLMGIQINSIEQSCCTCSKDNEYASIGIFAAYGKKG